MEWVADVDIRVRVSGGGHTSQIYAIRQAIAKSIVRLPPHTATEIYLLLFEGHPKMTTFGRVS